MMNKLYILGALALSAEAGWGTGAYQSLATMPQVGTVTYTVASADCYAALTTGTTLGMFATYK